MVPINHVGLTLAKRDTWKRMVGITLAWACWATGVGLTSNQRLAMKLARWAKWHRANVICRRWANKTADKMPALAQQMIAIWEYASIYYYVSQQRRMHLDINICNDVNLYFSIYCFIKVQTFDITTLDMLNLKISVSWVIWNWMMNNCLGLILWLYIWIAL